MSSREESVEFSLTELTRLEEERIRQAADEKAAHARTAMEKEAARKRAAMEEEAARKAAERRAELDALAQREAMQKAIVEQARLEVEARTRADERERERRHEIELASLRLESAREKPSPGLVPLAGAALLGGFAAMAVAIAIHLLVTTPTTAARIAMVERQRDDARARGDELERDATRRAMADLESRPAPSAAPSPARDEKPPRPARPNGPRPPRAEPPPAPVSSTCDMDPLCGTIRPR
jgi:hypothetical protein